MRVRIISFIVKNGNTNIANDNDHNFDDNIHNDDHIVEIIIIRQIYNCDYQKPTINGIIK